jgi:hypothetical protein
MGRFARVLRDGSRKNVSDQGGTRRERRQRHKVPARLGFIGDEIVDSISNYDFGQSRKEKYVGPGTGSITITPTRKGYSKTGGGSRMKIEERDRTGEAGWRRHIKKWDRDSSGKLIDSVIGGGGKKGPDWRNYFNRWHNTKNGN